MKIDFQLGLEFNANDANAVAAVVKELEHVSKLLQDPKFTTGQATWLYRGPGERIGTCKLSIR